MLVHILTGRFRKLFIGVKSTDTVARMKDKILRKERMFSNPQLFLGSTLPRDNITLAGCGITATSIIHILGPGHIPICIRTRTRKVFLDVQLSDTVQSVMSKINEREQIPEDQQRLIFRHQPLKTGWFSNTKLQDHNITAGATLHLVVRPDELDLYISTNSGNTLTMICLLEDTIADIKRRIAESEEVPVDHLVLPCGDDRRTLRETNIKPGTHLDVGECGNVSYKCIYFFGQT